MKVAVIFGGEVRLLEKDEIDGGTAHFGAYADPVIGDGLRSRTRYVIVHRGTGRSVATVGTVAAAIRLMARMESLPVNWGFRTTGGARYAAARRSLAALPKAQRKGLEQVYASAKKPSG